MKKEERAKERQLKRPAEEEANEEESGRIIELLLQRVNWRDYSINI